MSEELIQTNPIQIGRYVYYKLGNTTLNQLKQAKLIHTSKKELMAKKPDGLIILPGGSVKAVVEYKSPEELATNALIQKAIKQELEVAKLLCKILIVTDGNKTFWVNALSGVEINKNKIPISYVIDVKKLGADEITIEEKLDLENIIDQAEFSLTETINEIQEPEVLDPTPLAKEVRQKIWINTGKEPEKCLYNVVEIFVFKFLSDIGVLKHYNNFTSVYQLKETASDVEALKHYANRCRKDIVDMFEKGDDGTTIINGTIFVNEAGEPNISQSTLFGQVLDSFQKYDELNGSFRYVQKEFKTRLYETFLRQSAGVKNLGQYFTPRNVVRAMVKMSNASSLNPGARICDPFCGVGGFILETIFLNQHNIGREFEPVNQKIDPKITIVGYDKGTDEKDDGRTIILAKANMVIYFSDLLSKYHSQEYFKEFTKKVFNKVFYLLRSNLGTFELTQIDPFDIIITNPPYVTSGSGSLKESLQKQNLSHYYTAGGRGTESLAIEWVIRNLKPGGQGLIVVPDGLMNQENIITFIKNQCYIQGIISLPVRTFYATSKKTYILIIQKKFNKEIQTKPVFTFIVSEIGETRDAKRFTIEQNDLNEAEKMFNYYKTNNEVPESLRCKVIPFVEFDKYTNWLIERIWSDEEKEILGIIEKRQELAEGEFYNLINEIKSFLDTHTQRGEVDE